MKKLAVVLASCFLVGCASPLKPLEFKNLDSLPLREPEYTKPMEVKPMYELHRDLLFRRNIDYGEKYKSVEI